MLTSSKRSLRFLSRHAKITPEMKKSVSPVVILNVDAIGDQHSYLLMNPSAEGVFGLYVPFLPLAVRSATSLIQTVI